MRKRTLFILGLSVLIILACDLASTFSSDDSEQPVEEEMSVQEQIEATSRAIQTADALVQQAVDEALTALAPELTDTPEFTDTPVPTDTPTVTETPTVTSTPTNTPTATTSSGGGNPAGYTDCKDSSGGRTKVRVNNTTGNTAYLSLNGPESYQCIIPPGPGYQIFILGGIYNASAIMCGGRTFYFGSHVINSTWQLTLRCP